MTFWELARDLGEGVLLLICLAVVWLRVPPVPSLKRDLDRAFRFAQIKSGEVVFDLGAGYGRVLQIARDRYGARIFGWELNPPIWFLAKLRLGWNSDIELADLWQAPVEKADVVFIFLMANLMDRAERQIWAKMKPGSRMVSNAFAMPGVKPDSEEEGVYLYIKR